MKIKILSKLNKYVRTVNYNLYLKHRNILEFADFKTQIKYKLASRILRFYKFGIFNYLNKSI
jgi:hypothetical protein